MRRKRRHGERRFRRDDAPNAPRALSDEREHALHLVRAMAHEIRVGRFAFGALACALAAGCAGLRPPPPLPPQEIVVRVSAGEGEPLPGVSVRPSAGTQGVTDARGVTRILISGEEGAKVDLAVACPEGYAAPAGVTRVVVRRASKAPELDIPCKPYEHAVVIAFKTTGASGIPVLYLGREIARTDESGYALVELEPKVGETLEFTLDTSDPKYKFLRPQSPERTVQVPDGEEAFTIEQKFIEDKPKVKKAAAPRPNIPKELLPDK